MNEHYLLTSNYDIFTKNLNAYPEYFHSAGYVPGRIVHTNDGTGG